MNRIDGVLQNRLTLPRSRFDAVASRIKLISGLDIAERRYDNARLAWQAADERLQRHFQRSNVIERFYIVGALLGSRHLIAANDNERRIGSAASISD